MREIKPKPPCSGKCEKRKPGCHSECEPFIKYDHERIAYYEAIQERKEAFRHTHTRRKWDK